MRRPPLGEVVACNHVTFSLIDEKYFHLYPSLLEWFRPAFSTIQKFHRMEELKSTDDSVTHDPDGYAQFFISWLETTTNTSSGKTTTLTKSPSVGFLFPTQAHKARGKFVSENFLLLIKTRSEYRRKLNQQNVNSSWLYGFRWMMCANVEAFFGKNFRVFFVCPKSVM